MIRSCALRTDKKTDSINLKGKSRVLPSGDWRAMPTALSINYDLVMPALYLLFSCRAHIEIPSAGWVCNTPEMFGRRCEMWKNFFSTSRISQQSPGNSLLDSSRVPGTHRDESRSDGGDIPYSPPGGWFCCRVAGKATRFNHLISSAGPFVTPYKDLSLL